jgi:hypothetical protein
MENTIEKTKSLYEVEIKREQSAYFNVDNTWWDQDEFDNLSVDDVVEYFELTDLPSEIFREVETITVFDLDGNKVYQRERLAE